MISIKALDVEVLPNLFSFVIVDLNDYLNTFKDCVDSKGKAIPLTEKYSIEEIKKGWYNLDLCGYPTKAEEEILSPEETASKFIQRREELEVQLDQKINQILSLMK